jgi:hypothetical protein
MEHARVVMEPNFAEYHIAISPQEQHLLEHKEALLHHLLLLQRMTNLITLAEAQVVSPSIVVAPDEFDTRRD